MSTLPPRRTIQELELENSDEVSLYLELIRIIEKDIDEIKAGDTRSGWTSWAMLGGILGALLLFFGEVRKLQTFPTEQVEIIGLAGIFLYQIAVFSLRVFDLNMPEIRAGRIRWSKDTFSSYVPTNIYALLILIASILVTLSLPLPLIVTAAILAALIISNLSTILLLVSSRMKIALGNNKKSKRFAWLFFFLIYPLTVVSFFLLLNRMPFPVGETATVPYILAGLIVAIILLIGHLISTMAPSRLLSNLQDLRNDIIFLRTDIDEALQRYEVLTEGETLPDALKEELSEILNYLNIIEYTYENMRALLAKMRAGLPAQSDSSEVKKQKQDQLRLDRDSLTLHNAKAIELSNPLKIKLQKLNKKLSQVRAVSEDSASENYIRSFLSEKLGTLQKTEAELNAELQPIDFYMRNPDKIPQTDMSTGPDAQEKEGDTSQQKEAQS